MSLGGINIIALSSSTPVAAVTRAGPPLVPVLPRTHARSGPIPPALGIRRRHPSRRPRPAAEPTAAPAKPLASRGRHCGGCFLGRRRRRRRGLCTSPTAAGSSNGVVTLGPPLRTGPCLFREGAAAAPAVEVSRQPLPSHGGGRALLLGAAALSALP